MPRVTAVGVLVALAAALVVAVTPLPAAADTQTASNTAAIAIPAVQAIGTPPHSPGSVYPSPITISGLTGTTTKVTARLNNLSHTFSRDLDFLLVGPGGQSVVLMSDAGGNNPFSNQTLTFDDAASGQLPGTAPVTGTYQPTDTNLGSTNADLWPSPAPAGPYGSTFGAFNGTDPNGTWNLYVTDDASGDYGNLAGGWTLSVETGVATFPGQIQLTNVEYRGTEGAGVAAVTLTRVTGDDGAVGVTFSTGTGSATAGVDYTPVSQTVTFADGDTSETVNVPITDDPTVEGIDELIPISISAPTGGATLGSPTSGQIRLQDNDARANAFPIAIPATGPTIGAADPYPSNIVVAGASGVVTDVDVDLNDVSHTHIRDLDVLLVAPNGATTMLMQDVGPNTPVSDLELTFSDEAATGISQASLATGTYKPSQFDDEIPEALPPPAPAGPWGTTLGALDGTSPNGTWSLYIHDDANGDAGSIASGWSLTLETATASAGGPYTTPEGSGVTLSGSTTPNQVGATYEWDVDGDGQYDDATGANPTVSAGTLASIGLGDGPDSSSVRLRVTTTTNAVITSAATTLTITNVAPTATFTNNGPVTLGNTADVSFSGQTDPSSADTTAGFRYSYDFDDDGDWEVGDGTYAGSSTSASATVPTSVLNAVGTFDVNGRIIDKDGGFTDYTTTITVEAPPNVAPVADAGPDQEVNAGDTVTLDGTGSDDADDDVITYSWVQTAGPAVTLTGATTAQPTFTAPTGPATLTFELTVDDDVTGTDTDTVTITVNGVPTADAGPDQDVDEGDTVTLDGTGSTDPDSDTLTYSWEQTGGGTVVTLTGATTAQPTFTAPTGPDTLAFEVTVTDPGGESDTDTVIITVNALPTADAGPDQTVAPADTVTLDGTGSSDAEGVVTYSWVQTAGPAVTLVGSNTATPAFTAPATGVLTFELTVTDDDGATDTDTVTITVNSPPVADAGPDQLVNLGDTVTLDATGSSDPDSDVLTYSWVQTGGGTVVTLTGADTAQATFTAPEGADTLAFEVTVTDDDGETDTDTVIITINGPPTADAGPDQAAEQGDTVTLDGTGSTDPEGQPLLYSWVQVAGPAVTLVGSNTANPTFTAPAGPGTLTFELTVDDQQGRTDTDTVDVTLNRVPVADAGPDQEVNAGDAVSLDGSGSSDPEGDPIDHSWVQTAGPAVTLTGATTDSPTFTAPTGPATLTFELTVTDDEGLTDTDTVDVVVNGIPTADAGPDQDVNLGDTVTLDGTGSTDPDSDTLTYSWVQTGGGTVVTLTGATTAQPTFTAPEGPDTLAFELTVTDPGGETDTDTVLITVNGPPTADAGPDQEVNEGDTVTLDGTGSTDPDGDTLLYSWVQTAGPAVTLVGATTAQPTFTAPAAPGTLTFELTVDDQNGRTDTDEVDVTLNRIPTADAGPDQDVNAGDTVTLDGTGSSDPDGDTLTYSWVQTAGPAVTLSGATTAQPTFTAPTGPATLTFELTVADPGGETDTDTVTITVNGIPTADAGPDQEVNAGDAVTLDGTGSSDPDSDTLTYSWVQTGGGTVVTLTGATTANPTFTAPTGPDTLAFELTVDDGNGETDTDTVIIAINGIPTADAGPDQDVNLGDTVTLDGTGSTDPDGDTLTYSWVQTAGPAVTLTGATTANPAFTAPEGPATLTFELTVDDGDGETDTDTVDVTVNGPPAADAGLDQDVNGGDTVTLDGTGSDDPDGDTLTYSWAQTAGPAVTLTGATTAQPTFTAPTGPATLTFELTVDDGNGRTDTDTVTVTVNGIPAADAGPDQDVNLGDTVTLDGTGSSDPDGDTLTYSWEQTGGGTVVTLTGATTAQPTFTAPEGPDTLVFELTVDDGNGETDTDTVTITVNGPPTADAGDDQAADLGDVVTLDGTGSTDPDGDTLTYSWVQTAGPAVTLVGATTAQPTFVAPAGPATVTFELTVDDQQGRTDTDEVSVSLNGAPIADAGDDDEVNEGDTVTLDGTDSSDPDGDTLTYSWAQTAGTAVTLTGATTAQPTFTAPEGPANLVFTLTVSDPGGETDTDTVTIAVNGPPVADAGDDASVVERQTATLDGTGSIDPDGDTLSYSWVQDSGPTVTLTGATTATATFTVPDAPATLTFTLTVDDGEGRTDTDSVTITSLPRFTPNEAFVDHTYKVLLGRESDAGGRAFWVGWLDDGMTRTRVAKTIGFSIEASRGRVLDQRFEDWLGRAPDAGARDFWGPRINGGQPILPLELSILTSGEYVTHVGGQTPVGYVAGLYQTLLGRAPSPSESTYWSARVTALGRASVARSILTSTESERRRVRAAYLDVLDRPADPAGLDYWAGVLNATNDLRRVEIGLAAAWVNQPGSST